jgi:dolichol-phosphate mannosyltransferase
MTTAAIAAPALDLAPAPGRALDSDATAVFVIPAYNEEDNLPRLFRELARRPEARRASSRVLVVDDGSEDGTPGLVESYRGPLAVELIRLERNQGPGAAFRAGFRAALERCGDGGLVVTLEADSTGDLNALPEMLARARSSADLVLAAWVMENVGLRRRLLSEGAGLVVRLLLGLRARTVSSFFRVYRAEALRGAFDHFGDDLIREQGFACKAELLAKLIGLGACVEEVPVALDTSQRVGKSKMPVARTMAAYWRMMARQVFSRGPAAW